MELLQKIKEGEIESFEWFYFIALALILAFGTIQTTGTALDTERPVVSVISCSMYPVYSVGDILVVNGEEFEEIEVKDIIVYEVPERIDFKVDGESYTLEKNSPLNDDVADTKLGKVKLHQIEPDTDHGNDKALISINGEKYTLSEEKNTVKDLKVEMIAEQPFPIVHRVIEKEKNYLQTKGDANQKQLDFESDVRPFQVYGTASLRIPRVGAIKLLIMDLVGFNGDKPLIIDNFQTCESKIGQR